MKLLFKLPPARMAVLLFALLLSVLWGALNFPTLTATQNGWIRFFLTIGFGLLIVLRPKPPLTIGAPPRVAARVPAWAAGAGIVLVVLGLSLGVGQLEWLGLLLVIWGCLRWSLPRRYGRDLALAFPLIYFAHPLPAQVFGPLQLAMQRLSVKGAELLLIGLDVRVWAHDMVLYTGFSVYEVPAWCSGMRAATTVFLLALGLCILNRFRWHEYAVFIAAGLVQALALNILRIAAMVVLVPAVFSGSSVGFLHDTAGLIVLTAVFLVVAETAAWRRRKRRRAAPPDVDAEPQRDRTIEGPHDLEPFRRHRGRYAAGLVAMALLTLVVYRNSPARRRAVLEDVATSARDAGNYEEALRLTHLVIEKNPDNVDWKLTLIRLLLVMEEHETVLESLSLVPDSDSRTRMEKNILRAYALMALDRIDEAATIVKALPEWIQRVNPRVAMIVAVMGYHAGEPDVVADHIRLASEWPPNMPRVRQLYPFLREHRKWDAIRVTDSRDKASVYAVEPMLAAAEAYMNLDETPRVGQLASQAARYWPRDARVLEPLFYMSLKRPDGPWEARFVEQFLNSLRTIDDPDTLYALFDKCFELGRPDLAWALYRRIEALDPDHPALPMSLVRFGRQWFEFRRRLLGFPSATPFNRIDLRNVFALSGALTSWERLADWVPAGESLAVPDVTAARRRFLDEALAAFDRRREAGRLSLAMSYLHAFALELSGDVPASRRALEAVAEEHPGENERVRIALSEMYERRNNWEEVYEILRSYQDHPDPVLPALLRLGEAQLNLRLQLMAAHTASRARTLYPRSATAVALEARTLLESDRAEEALFLVSRPRPRHVRDLDILTAQALLSSERYSAVEDFCHQVLLPRPRITAGTPQRVRLPPAEMGSLWHLLFTPSERDFAQNAAVLRANLEQTESPFLAGLMRQWLAAYESRCGGDSALPETWIALGRDRYEEAIALNQLTLLLCREGRHTAARLAAQDAVARFPESPMLWRWLVGLGGADGETLREARDYCPDDPELWLTDLVRRVDTAPDEDVAAWVRRYANTENPRMPAEAVARASEFLIRRDFREAGCAIMRDAVRRSRGCLPIDMHGIRCALIEGDTDWAIHCTRQAIASTLRERADLYRKLVYFKTLDNELDTDFDMVEALKSLRKEEPGNVMWAQMLGYVRFQRGGWEVLDAFNQMSDAIQGGATNKLVFSIAAEASRLLNNHERAAEILRRGRRHFPNDVAMLNNLVYLLTRTLDGLDEARELLPELLALGDDNLQVLDTAGTVYVETGEWERALDAAERVIAGAESGSAIWFRAHMHKARYLHDTGELRPAIELLNETLNASPGLPDDDIVEANRLLNAWRRQRDTESLPAGPAVRAPSPGSGPGTP